MTSPSAFLYRYTPGSVGMVRIFACRSMKAVFLFYWMGTQLSVLQKGQMSRPSLGKLRSGFSGQTLDRSVDSPNQKPNLGCPTSRRLCEMWEFRRTGAKGSSRARERQEFLGIRAAIVLLSLLAGP